MKYSNKRLVVLKLIGRLSNLLHLYIHLFYDLFDLDNTKLY